MTKGIKIHTTLVSKHYFLLSKIRTSAWINFIIIYLKHKTKFRTGCKMPLKYFYSQFINDTNQQSINKTSETHKSC